jgi:hypothetical protein
MDVKLLQSCEDGFYAWTFEYFETFKAECIAFIIQLESRLGISF